MEAVQADEGRNVRLAPLFGGDQFAPDGKIDPVGAGITCRRAAHDHVDLPCAALPQIPDTVPAGGSPDDRILDDHDLLVGDQRLYRIEFDPDPEIPHRLARLDEGPPHIMVSDHPHFEREPTLLRIPESGIVSRIGEGHHEVRIGTVFPGKIAAQPLPAEVDVLAENLAVGP